MNQQPVTVYRLVKYTGSQAWLDSQLDRSLPPGVRKTLEGGSITVTVIDSEDEITVELVRNKFRQLETHLSLAADPGFVE